MIHDMIGGGGGASLNFKVVGSTSAPASPKENTIWVNTSTEITSWVFSATEPESPAAGMVWISVGASSPVAFNALKKNNITVYPLSAKQYVNGAWVDKTAKSYQGGAWVEWMPEGALYFRGDQVESVTGGWQLTNFGNWSSNGAVEDMDDGLSLSISGKMGVLYTTKQLINKGNYTKLCFLITNYQKVSGTFSVYVGTATKNTAPFVEDVTVKSTPTSNGVCKVDISNASTSFYAACGATGYPAEGQVTFYEVWME